MTQRERLLEIVRTLPANELPRFLGELEEVRITGMARLASPEPQHDELVGVEAAAKRLGVSENHLYHHHDRYAFTRRNGRKLLFSSAGIDAYIRQK